jgi:hypothetical protein
MNYLRTLSLLLLGSSLISASSLSVYQNKSIYVFNPAEGFIGLTKGVSGKCNGESVTIETQEACPKTERLCTLYDKALDLNSQTRLNSSNMQVLKSLITLPKPASVDAKSMIEAARSIAREETRLVLEKEALTQKSKRLKHLFAKQTRNTQPVGTTLPCKSELELTLPYGYVSFSTEYEAELLENEIRVRHNLAVMNHSGIDIKADKAHFYYRSAQPYVRPVHFSPWIVGEHKEYLRRNVRKHSKSKMIDAAPVEREAMTMAMAAPVPMKASYEDAREYTVKALELPSTGEEKKIPVMEWRVAATCQEELHAYRNSTVFNVCSFTPKFQIEQNRWKIMKEGKILNESAMGEYEKENYRLYVSYDPDIKVIRQKIVLKERETGIFGSTARKKDGFVLTLTNKSEKRKKIKITERIPVSNTEKIKVKLLSVKGSKPVNYHILKDGKVEMDVVLASRESQKIEIVFEISYNKDLKIDY